MSTKCSLYFDQKMHMYQEICDHDFVYFQTEEDNVELKQKFTIEQIVSVSKCFDYERLRKQANLTDEQILNHVTSFVKNRINSSSYLDKMAGVLVYGLPDEPEETQIANASKFYFEKRNKLKNIFDSIESNKRKYCFQFGLEEII